MSNHFPGWATGRDIDWACDEDRGVQRCSVCNDVLDSRVHERKRIQLGVCSKACWKRQLQAPTAAQRGGGGEMMTEESEMARDQEQAQVVSDLKPGDPVWYYPSPGVRFSAVIAGPVGMCGDTPVVRLHELPIEYSRDYRKDPPRSRRSHVSAAALFAIKRRMDESAR